MVQTFIDEFSLELALNSLVFDGDPIIVVKGQVFSIVNIVV